MFNTKMSLKNYVKIIDLINAEIQAEFNDARNELHYEAKQQSKMQNCWMIIRPMIFLH